MILAVLLDAIRCLKGESGPGRTRRRLVAEAKAWVDSTDTRWPFSFENICTELGLEAMRLRPKLLAMAAEILPDEHEGRLLRRSGDPHPHEAEIHEMIRAGQPLRVVAARFGVSVPQVSRMSRKLASRLKAERDGEIRGLRRAGWSHRAIAMRFGLSRIRIMQICRGIERPHTPRTVAMSGASTFPVMRFAAEGLEAQAS